MRNLVRWSPAVLLLAAACGGVSEGNSSGSEADLAPAAVSATPQTRIVHALPRGRSSTLSVRTLPNAACTLRPANEAPGAREHLRVYADDDGIARLFLQDRGGGSRQELALDCADDAGRRFSHSVRIDVADGVRGQAPAPFSTAGKRQLPVLEVDPMSLSAQQIAARGYPPRPDPQTAPAQYRKWLSLTSRKPAMIAPHLFSDPSRFHGPMQASVSHASGTSTNWSGYVIATGANAPQYGEVFGAWHVPRAYAEGGFWHLDYSSLWVGIDGWGTPDVVQAGTDQNTETIFWVQASSYWAWTEWYPLNAQLIFNFPVNPGDEIYTWVWVGNAQGAWTPSGGVGWFYLWNVSQNVVAAYLSTAAPSGTVFNGHQAEWVMERPTVFGSLSSLANYSTAQIFDAWAYDFAYQPHYYTSDYSLAISMTGNSGVLSTVAPVNSMAMQFTWHGYD